VTAYDPESRGLAPVSVDEVLAGVLASKFPGGAMDVAAAFRYALTCPDGPLADFLSRLVTPESLPAWGDFADARQMLLGSGMLTSVGEPSPGVAYVVFTDDLAQDFVIAGDDNPPVPARAIATLVFQQGAGEWQVHAVGEPVLPHELPAGIA
jgi:hypothetical protein